jgi:hypothetical protein
LDRRLDGYQSRSTTENALNKYKRKKQRKREVKAKNFIKEINNKKILRGGRGEIKTKMKKTG